MDVADTPPAPEACTVTAHQEMCVDADVTVTPRIHAEAATTRCVGKPELDVDECEDDGCGRGGRHHAKNCGFRVRQKICVTVPLTFGATVEVAVDSVECGTPMPGPCRK